MHCCSSQDSCSLTPAGPSTQLTHLLACWPSSFPLFLLHGVKLISIPLLCPASWARPHTYKCICALDLQHLGTPSLFENLTCPLLYTARAQQAEGTQLQPRLLAVYLGSHRWNARGRAVCISRSCPISLLFFTTTFPKSHPPPLPFFIPRLQSGLPLPHPTAVDLTDVPLSC